MHDKQNGHSPALSELHGRLEAGLARARLSKTQLARQARLGRTTVWAAFQLDGPVPSAETVVAVARVLKLPEEELLELRRAAAGKSGATLVEESGPGRPIRQWEPHALEVHPAGPGEVASGSASAVLVMPRYVQREHDRVLAKAVGDAAVGRSRLIVLVGSSSTGKTRACWEAVQPLADKGWRLWHPYDPTRAEAALVDLHRVQPRTVVWLNEAQHYLGDRTAGERIAAAVHRLLVSPERGPVLVLGTLWPEYAAQYTGLPTRGGGDPHSRVRELLSGHTLAVPDAFDAGALAAAATFAQAGDQLLADALARVGADGRVTQDLAGAPELLRRYQHATPAAKALLEAAMDARRLGIGLHLPQTFLTDAASDYLSQTDYDQLTDDWAERAFAALAEPVHGKHAPLRRTTLRPPQCPPAAVTAAACSSPPSEGPVLRLADYLEQHGRSTRKPLCPPASFWHAAHAHLADPNALANLAAEAEIRHRLQWAHHLRHRAAHRGHLPTLHDLTVLRVEAGDPQGAEVLALQIVDRGSLSTLSYLSQMRAKAGDLEGAGRLVQQAVDRGNTHALYSLSQMRAKAGDLEGAERLLQQAADQGDSDALYELAMRLEAVRDREGAEAVALRDFGQGRRIMGGLALLREESGDRQGALAAALKAADRGDPNYLFALAMKREEAGDAEGAEKVALKAAEHHTTTALCTLAVQREQAADQTGAERLALKAADHGDALGLLMLATMRMQAGDSDEAERLASKAADHGDAAGLLDPAMVRMEAGDLDGAERLLRQAASHGNTRALRLLSQMREKAGDRADADSLLRQAADQGDPHAMYRLAMVLEEAGDRQGAEVVALKPTGDHYTDIPHLLADMRVEAGDRDGAECLLRQVADRGDNDALYRLAMMREKAGDQQGAERLLRRAADRGESDALIRLSVQGVDEYEYPEEAEALEREIDRGRKAFNRVWPYGLDPDGTPTPQWSDCRLRPAPGE
ncbi:hypothetical protein [Streptomyces sp. Tue6028]|uniref:hypothetical protein n=1 Tax=Streptomyces sp. Tue6028 TaxID=2036037 RepID=UPI003EB84C8B